MSKLIQRKSFLSLVLCMFFVHCGGGTKKSAGAAPAETTVAMATAKNLTRSHNNTAGEEKPGTETPPTEQPPETPKGGGEPEASNSPIRILSPYEQGLTSPNYPAAPAAKGVITPETKAKQDAEAVAKRKEAADAQIKRVKAAQAKRDADAEAARLKAEADKKKAEEDAEKKRIEEEKARQKIQDELDAAKREYDRQQAELKKLQEANKQLASDSTTTKTTNDSIPDALKLPPNETQLPNDSMNLKTDSIPDTSKMPLLDIIRNDSIAAPADSSQLAVNPPLIAADTTAVATPKLNAPVDNSGKRMTDVLEDLSESLLLTAPGSTAEEDHLDQIFAEFKNPMASFKSLDERLENIFLMAKRNERFAKALQDKNIVRGSAAAESSIAGPLWFAFDVQARSKFENLDTNIIDIYRDKSTGKSTITVSTTYFPTNQWENASSRTKDSKKQLDSFRQVWNALVASGYNLTSGYPTIVGFSNKKDDNMAQVCELVRSYLIEQDKAVGNTNSNYQLFGNDTITTGNYWTSKKQRRVEIRIADVQR